MIQWIRNSLLRCRGDKSVSKQELLRCLNMALWQPELEHFSLELLIPSFVVSFFLFYFIRKICFKNRRGHLWLKITLANFFWDLLCWRQSKNGDRNDVKSFTWRGSWVESIRDKAWLKGGAKGMGPERQGEPEVLDELATRYGTTCNQRKYPTRSSFVNPWWANGIVKWTK